jgi:thioredoxin
MRVKEIKTELQELKIDFTDCFDKESLVFRLQDAREGKVKPKEEDATTPATTEESSSASSETSTTTTSVDEPAEDVIDTFDKETALNELRGMTVRDLREELGRRQISRSGLFEKEDLVQALLKGREQASKFSATGILQPGQVTDLTGDQLQQELQHPTPMLLDVYATWCGPCKMMVPILNEAAADLGDTVRVVKMDSDKYPEVSGQLRVGGLPTLILLKNGQEVDRIEGALMKDQLLGWISSKL